MGELGFWALAQADPGHVALVDPDGREISAGQLLAACNRVVHGLRALGLQPGDVVAAVLPNGAELIELYLACLQAGRYLVPVNHHLVGTEIAYIVGDSEAKVFVAHERFAERGRGRGRRTRPSSAGRARSVGSVPGFRPFTELTAGQPADLPSDRTTGAVMNYTSGTTGRPKGVRRALSGLAPKHWPPPSAGCC